MDKELTSWINQYGYLSLGNNTEDNLNRLRAFIIGHRWSIVSPNSQSWFCQNYNHPRDSRYYTSTFKTKSACLYYTAIRIIALKRNSNYDETT